jgi:hypothetical protein
VRSTGGSHGCGSSYAAGAFWVFTGMTTRTTISRIRFSIQFLRRTAISTLTRIPLRLSIAGHQSPSYAGIVLHDIREEGKSGGRFAETTSVALDLIARVDPVSFAGIGRRISYILNVRLRSPIIIYLGEGSISVDLTRWPFGEAPDWSLREYACSLGMASVWWRFWARRIPLTKGTRKKIILCALEDAKRFANRFEDSTFH